MALLFTADAARAKTWRAIFAAQLPDLDFRIWPDIGDPQDIRYLVGWQLHADIMAQLQNLELVFSIGAGVDQLNLDLIPAHLPLVRMLEPGIQQGMVEYVVMAVLALHRDLFRYMDYQKRALWQPHKVPAAATRRVGVMGLGDLGQRCLAALAPFGFARSGWSRSAHSLPGIACFHGDEGLSAFLAQCDILICLLPLTNETRGILNAGTLAQLPRGAALIHVARGGHMVSADVLAALESGQLSAAMLDVFEQEPLPHDHPLWHHPRVVITPHISGQTSHEQSALALIENLRRHWAGAPMLGVVDRARGY